MTAREPDPRVDRVASHGDAVEIRWRDGHVSS